MQKTQSHGRGLFQNQRSIFLAAVLALATSVSVGVYTQVQNKNGEGNEVSKGETQLQLRMAKILLDQAFDQIKVQSSKIERETNPVLNGTWILQWARFQIEDDQTARSIEKNAMTVLGAPIGPQLISADAHARLALGSLKVAPIKAGSEMAFVSLKPYLGLIQKGLAKNQYLFSVVDPKTVFSSLGQFDTHTDSGDLRAYLMSEDGAVWGHSQASYVGTDFSSTAVFMDMMRAPQGSAARSPAGFAQARAVDQLYVMASYLRFEGMPFMAVVEKSINEPSWVRTLFSKDFTTQVAFYFLGAFGFFSVFFRGIAEISNRKRIPESANEDVVENYAEARNEFRTNAHEMKVLERKLKKAKRQEEETASYFSPKAAKMLGIEKPVEKPVSPLERFKVPNDVSLATPRLKASPAEGVAQSILSTTPTIQLGENRPEVASAMQTLGQSTIAIQQHENVLRREIQALNMALKRMLAENQILAQFEEDSIRFRDPNQVVQKMTLMAANLCRGPSMFFAYQENHKSFVLQSAAGFAPSDKPMQARLPAQDALLGEIAEQAKETTVIPVSDYEPLAQLILARTGIAHFEAWAITGYSHLGRLASRPRILGIMVILNAGSESVKQRETISRMVRSTGLIYENTLLSSLS